MKMLEEVIKVIGCRNGLLRIKNDTIIGYDSFMLKPFYDHDEVSLIKLKGNINFLSEHNNFDLNVDIKRNRLDVICDGIRGIRIRICPYGYINPSLIPSVEADMPPSEILNRLGWSHIVLKLEENPGGDAIYFSTKLSTKPEYGNFTLSLFINDNLNDEMFASNIAKLRNRYINTW